LISALHVQIVIEGTLAGAIIASMTRIWQSTDVVVVVVVGVVVVAAAAATVQR